MTSKRVTSFDVAKKAGVSRTTVSLVLNNVPGINIRDDTRQRVRQVAKELNYHPDSRGRKLASGRSNTIGLVLRQSHEQVFADALLPQVLLGIEQAASRSRLPGTFKTSGTGGLRWLYAPDPGKPRGRDHSFRASSE